MKTSMFVGQTVGLHSFVKHSYRFNNASCADTRFESSRLRGGPGLLTLFMMTATMLMAAGLPIYKVLSRNESKNIEQTFQSGSVPSVTSSGEVIDSRGVKLGSIDQKGNAYNTMGIKVGFVLPSGKIFRRLVLLPLGRVDDDGNVKNIIGRSVGKIDIPGLSMRQKGAVAILMRLL